MGDGREEGGRAPRAAAGSPASAPPPHARRPTGLPVTAPFGLRPIERPRPAGPARHCWVTLPADRPEARPGARPGLLLEWRRGEAGRWEGRVVYVAELRPGRWATIEEWVPAALLSAR